MDFKRIEWLFFLVFLSLDIFLFTLYWEGMNEENSVSLTEQTESIEKRLAKEKITYSGQLSNEKFEGYYLSAEQTNFGQFELQNDFYNRVDRTENTITVYPQMKNNVTNYFINGKEVKKSLETFLYAKDNVVYGDQYEYLAEFSNINIDFPEVYVFQKYKNISFKDDTAQISFKLEKLGEQEGLYKINKYTQAHIQEVEELRDKMDLYSEKDAIDTLYINNKITSNSKIVFRKLAYSRIYKIREKNVYVPVWFIGIQAHENTLQIEQVNAMNNIIITTSLVPKVEDH